MYDIDKAIKDCQEHCGEDEVVVYAIGAGRVAPVITRRKAMKKAADAIKKTKGFIGIYPIDLWHTLLVYKTLNDAKSAKNELTSEGCPLGNIAPIVIKKEYLPQ